MIDFLNSTILPGENIPKHEHRRMLVVLLIVMVASIIIGLFVWFKINKENMDVISNENTENISKSDSLIDSLQKSIVNIPDQQRTDAIRDLDRSIVPILDKDRIDIIKGLQK